MFLVRVEVRTSQGALLNLPLDDDSTGLFVEEIEGLDPVKATLVSSSVAGVDGEQYHSSHRESRNIKLKLAIEPDYLDDDVAALRARLYAYFMPKAAVSLRFVMSNAFYFDINGRVESFESPLFTKDPEANLSVMCFDPDFIDPNPVNITKMSSSGALSTLVAPANLFTYTGSVDAGALFTIRPDRALSAFTIYHQPPDGTLRALDFAMPLIAGDKLAINTVTGAKGITLTRGSTLSSALYGMSPQSPWLEFQPGANYLMLYAVGAPLPFDVSYITRYGGL